MEDLKRYLTAVLVDRAGHDFVLLGLGRRRHLARQRQHPALSIRRDASGHDESSPASRPFGVERSHLLEAAVLLEAGVHRAHERPVPHLEAARQRQRTEEARVRGMWLLCG